MNKNLNHIPRISVLMPVYNCELYIKESVSSVLNQTFKDFELLIIDDCSIDNTVAIVQEFKDDRIQLILKEKNSGYTDSLNSGISIAKGEYIARMDGDDICCPERFEKQVKFLDNHPEIILCGTGIQIIDSEKVLKHPLNHDEIKVKLCFTSSFYHPTVMGQTIFFKQNLYDKSFEPAEDYELWTRLIDQGKLANLDAVLLKYRVHNNQISNVKNTIQKEGSLKCRIKMLRNLGISDYSEGNKIREILENKPPQNIAFCKSAIDFYDFLIEKNKSSKEFDVTIFSKKMKNAKWIVLRAYFTKTKMLKWDSIVFLLKNLTIYEFFEFLNLKKRVSTFFS